MSETNTRNTRNSRNAITPPVAVLPSINSNSRTFKERMSNTFTNIGDTISDASRTVSERVGSIKNAVVDAAPEEDSVFWTILKAVVFLLIFVAILWVIVYFYGKYEANIISSPMLLAGTKNAKQGSVISQDPKSTNYLPIVPSEGQNGVEFSYSFWMEIDDMTYKSGQWKHVFHKGNTSSYPNRAPGVWIHPSSNALRIYMNTQDQILEYVDVDGIPLRKWFHVVIVLRNKTLDIYINGFLKVRKELSSLPRQNNGDFWMNMFGGYEGYLGNVQYFAAAISFEQIQAILKAGPSMSSCQQTGELPPYQDSNWWFSQNSNMGL